MRRARPWVGQVSTEDATPWGMSWEDARQDAQRWIDTLRLPNVLTGQTLDLRAAAASLRFTGEYRRMVLEAARRKLVKRKAREVIFE